MAEQPLHAREAGGERREVGRRPRRAARASAPRGRSRRPLARQRRQAGECATSRPRPLRPRTRGSSASSTRQAAGSAMRDSSGGGRAVGAAARRRAAGRRGRSRRCRPPSAARGRAGARARRSRGRRPSTRAERVADRQRELRAGAEPGMRRQRLRRCAGAAARRSRSHGAAVRRCSRARAQLGPAAAIGGADAVDAAAAQLDHRLDSPSTIEAEAAVAPARACRPGRGSPGAGAPAAARRPQPAATPGRRSIAMPVSVPSMGRSAARGMRPTGPPGTIPAPIRRKRGRRAGRRSRRCLTRRRSMITPTCGGVVELVRLGDAHAHPVRLELVQRDLRDLFRERFEQLDTMLRQQVLQPLAQLAVVHGVGDAVGVAGARRAARRRTHRSSAAAAGAAPWRGCRSRSRRRGLR